MNYISELKFSDRICSLLENQGYVAKTEVNSGYGIADVVAIKFNMNNIVQRQNYEQNAQLDRESYFKILEHTSEDATFPTSTHEVVLKTGFSRSYIKSQLLSDLADQGFIRFVGEDQFVKVNGWAPLSEQVIAIESKLHNWKRGLMQALRYKTFADIVYLALPPNKIHVVNHDELNRHNIGLLTVDNEKVQILLAPQDGNCEIINSKKNYVCEQFWPIVTNSHSFAKF